MHIEVSNLTSKLVTDNPELLNKLSEKYSFKVPGYQYTPQYKRRVWDGSKTYFKKNGSFRTGILDRVIDDLVLIGVDRKNLVISGEPKIVDDFYLDVINVKNYDYYDYQKEAIEGSLRNKRGIIDSPTGSGKTLIMAGLVKSLQVVFPKMTILFRAKSILNQTYEFFKSAGIDNVGINSGEGYIYGDIMLSTVQSIEKIIDTHLESSQVLMVDEVHEFSKGDTTVAAIEAFPNAIFRFGFTGTIPSLKEDPHARLTLEGAFGKVYKTRTTDELINDGKLAKPIIQIIEYAPSGVDLDIDYQSAYDKYIIKSKDRNDLVVSIVESIAKNSKKAKILILVKNLEHLKQLHLLLGFKNINSVTIEGSDNIQDRYWIINKFIKSKEPIVLIGTNVMQTGVNINEISHMINARGLEGEIPTLQGLGRGLRTSDGKSTVYFYDFYDKVPYLETHSKKRIKHYENAKFEVSYVKI